MVGINFGSIGWPDGISKFVPTKVLKKIKCLNSEKNLCIADLIKLYIRLVVNIQIAKTHRWWP